jgi:hypothetical protein
MDRKKTPGSLATGPPKRIVSRLKQRNFLETRELRLQRFQIRNPGQKTPVDLPGEVEGQLQVGLGVGDSFSV